MTLRRSLVSCILSHERSRLIQYAASCSGKWWEMMHSYHQSLRSTSPFFLQSETTLFNIWRVNHRLATYKRADISIFGISKPHKDELGWEKTDDGSLEPLWSCGPILPTCLVDLIQDTARETPMRTPMTMTYKRLTMTNALRMMILMIKCL